MRKHRVRRLLPGVMTVFLLIGMAMTVHAGSSDEFKKEIPLLLTRNTNQFFWIYMPPEIIEEQDSWTQRWHIEPEECEGRDEVFFRMDLPETTFLLIDMNVYGSLKCDVMDSNKNVLTTASLYTSSFSESGLWFLTREVYPAGTYYFRFHNFTDIDCVGYRQLSLRVMGMDKQPANAFHGKNTTKAAAYSLKDGKIVSDYFCRFDGSGTEHWYKFKVEDAQSVSVSLPGKYYIDYTMFDEAGNVLLDSQTENNDIDLNEMHLSDGTYYVKLKAIHNETEEPHQTFWRDSTYFGSDYAISFKQTKNFHPVPATKLVLTPEKITVPASLFLNDQRVRLTAKLYPKNTTDTLVWSVGNPDVASVLESNPKGNVYTCEVYSDNLEGGKTFVTASVKGDSKLTAKCAVTVTPLGVSEAPDTSLVRLPKKTFSMYAKESAHFAYKKEPFGAKVVWKSSAKSVATVTKEGILTAKKKGKTKVSVFINGKKKATCTVTVKSPSVSCSKSKVTVKNGKTVTVKITIKPVLASESPFVFCMAGSKVRTTLTSGKTRGTHLLKIQGMQKGKDTINIKVTAFGKTFNKKIKVTVK